MHHHASQEQAETMEAAHKSALAKGEVGIREKEPVPVAAFVARRQLDQVQISTINRDLATLLRMFHLAIEWGPVKTFLRRIQLLPGENHRERVLSLDEEAAYLDAASQIGHDIERAYRRALKGIRAVERGQEPRRSDSYILRDVTTILFDCALRPEPAPSGRSRHAQGDHNDRLDFPRADSERSHRSLNTEEAARRRPRSGVEAFVLYTLRHPPRSRRPLRHEHDQTLRSPGRGAHPRSEVQGLGWS